MTPGAKVRARAAKTIAAVIGGAALDRHLVQNKLGLSEVDQGFLSALCYGTLRRLPRHNAVLGKLLRNPKKPINPTMRALLVLGLEQLIATRVPEHAALDATVAASRLVNQSKGAGFLNAVLRRFQRERDDIEASLKNDEPFKWSHPQWLIDKFRGDWPDDWQSILEANNAQPPMSLRINSLRTTREDYAKMLHAEGLQTAAFSSVATAITLEKPCQVDQLPHFADGWVSVQDAGAQCAADFMDLVGNQKTGTDESSVTLRVLDACAAPGGKTFHMMERRADILMTALDISGDRLARVEENANRLGHKPTLVVGSAIDPEDWWDGQAYDRILIDAPCSGSGVMRRHPDIKTLRRPKDAKTFPTFQKEMLNRLWPLLAPGGRMIYATCSVFPQENERLIAAWLPSVKDAQSVPLKCSLSNAKSLNYGVQILPSATGSDGFYYAAIVKRER